MAAHNIHITPVLDLYMRRCHEEPLRMLTSSLSISPARGQENNRALSGEYNPGRSCTIGLEGIF